jgi:hypothetical protein
MKPETSAVVLIAGGAMLLWWTAMMVMGLALAGPVPGEALTMAIAATLIAIAAMFIGVAMEEEYA